MPFAFSADTSVVRHVAAGPDNAIRIAFVNHWFPGYLFVTENQIATVAVGSPAEGLDQSRACIITLRGTLYVVAEDAFEPVTFRSAHRLEGLRGYALIPRGLPGLS